MQGKRSFHNSRQSDAYMTAPNPIDAIEEDHALQLILCNVLETVADGLPAEVDFKCLGILVPILRVGMPRQMQFEDDVFFPMLRERASIVFRICEILEQLESEHQADQDYAYELADELELLEQRRAPWNKEMLGYMLRGFFEGQRRHIECENMIILPLAREVFRDSDLQRLHEPMTIDEFVLGGRLSLRTVLKVSNPTG